MGYILTNTLKNQRNTHKFNAYSGSNRRSTHKTQNAPPQIALQRGSFMHQNGKSLDFKRFSGVEKVHRNSIKITVDLWWTRGDSNP